MIDFEKTQGLVPVIVQDALTEDVLMLGFMNAEALKATQASGEVTFYSRSRKKLWKKGETSGHKLRVRELRLDCDGDAILARVEVAGQGVCHEGYRSCFYRRLEGGGALVTEERVFNPAEVYKDGKRP